MEKELKDNLWEGSAKLDIISMFTLVMDFAAHLIEIFVYLIVFN
jgi:hypothetical protein